jgi:glycosyltransferase involved in cell wall biosynthesis
MSALQIGYLISRYPAISHTFILREVMELRTLGFDIRVASINDCDRAGAALTPAERTEWEHCFYVKKAAARFLWDFLLTLAANPWGLARAALFALCANGPHLRRSITNLFYLAEAVLVAQWMRRSRLTHLHVHFATPAATVGLLVSKIAPAGFSMTVHGPEEFYNTEAYLLPGKCAESRFLCAISDFAASQLMKMMPAEQWSKIEVVPLGVDPEVFAPVSRPASRESGREFFQLLCVGRLVPEKGQHILLDAVSRLRQQGRDVRLILAGDGPSRAALEAFVRGRGMQPSVTFTGAINQDQIRAIYARADAFVLASFAEGVPVVLMEAMAMEIPCVATWIAGIPELIGDGTCGLLVSPGNPVALAAAIARLLDDASLRLSLGEAGRRQVIEKYNLKSNVARLGRVFEHHLAEAVYMKEQAA